MDNGGESRVGCEDTEKETFFSTVAAPSRRGSDDGGVVNGRSFERGWTLSYGWIVVR